MKRILLLIWAVQSLSQVAAQAQDAMTPLRTKYADHPDILTKIDQFVQGGYARPFDCGDHTRDEFIAAAKVYLGVPYQFGGTNERGMDCSGLIFRTFTDLGLKAPHGAQELARFGQIILDKEELRSGDVIFFTKTYATDKLVTHAAFVIEHGQMIHASTSKGVQAIPIDDPYYWNEHFLFGTRIFIEP